MGGVCGVPYYKKIYQEICKKMHINGSATLLFLLNPRRFISFFNMLIFFTLLMLICNSLRSKETFRFFVQSMRVHLANFAKRFLHSFFSSFLSLSFFLPSFLLHHFVVVRSRNSPLHIILYCSCSYPAKFIVLTPQHFTIFPYSY